LSASISIEAAPLPPLSPGEVHLWRQTLDETDPVPYQGWLSPDEVARMARFKMPFLRTRFAVARGTLRCLAGRYLEVSPEKLTFRYGAHGKPELDGLHFNISHSGGRLAVAFGCDGPLGLDIEQISPRLHARDIAGRYFSAREREELDTADDAEYLRRFYRLWTAKEAVMKATALGFALELANIEIGLNPLRLVSLNWDGPRDWELRDVAPGEDCAGTLACRPGCTVREFSVAAV
jgi:4'-phosphopantetheinyl transferase